MNNNSHLMFSLLGRNIYETIETRIPDSSFLDSVKPLLSSHWKIYTGGFWTQIHTPENKNISHGWKIHISATITDGHEMLRKVLPCIVKHQVNFKLLSDEFALRLSLSKNMPRMQVGKFITIYPQSPEQCRLIAEELAQLTKEHAGPYILTDQAIGESKNVYVRFGAHIANYRPDRYGNRIPGYYDGNGQWKADRRGFPSSGDTWSWKNDHSNTEATVGNIGPIRIGGHYSINKAIRYNGEGGIYQGIDERTNMPIVVREQRRGVGSSFEKSAVESGYTIKKEARLLKIAEKSGLTPRYVDHFEEDEHWFLVQERLAESDTLWGHAMEIYFNSQDTSGRGIFERIKSLFIRIASGLKSIHSYGIVLRDLTRTNVLVTKDGQIRFIDLEFAHVIDEQSSWTQGWTPGYGSPQQQGGDTPSVRDDYYALGALFLDALTFCAPGLELDSTPVMRRLRRNLHDLMFPEQFEDIISGLLDENPDKRWILEKTIQSLQSMSYMGLDTSTFPTSALPHNIKHNSDGDYHLCKKILTGIDEFLRTSATWSRHDRLWPASPQIWTVNPVCIGYGASGVALYQQKAGTLESHTLNWIIERSDPKTCPPGLFAGMAGVAWLLAECNELSQAIQIMDQVWENNDDTNSSLYFGLAGIGLVELKLFQESGDRQHLSRAEDCALKIQAESRRNENGVYWVTAEQTKLGFAEGQSGIALFFLYLYHATGNIDYLTFGRSALDFDLTQCIDVNGHQLWYSHTNALSHDPKTPHLWAGTAGIAAVLLRYYYSTHNSKYGSFLRKLENTISHRFTNKIWQCEGLAGMVEFHLDMMHFFPERGLKHKAIAWHLAEGLMDHALTLDTDSFKGMAFAGVEHMRICSDYGYGTSGIALCLHRLLYGGHRSLFLDSMFNTPPKADNMKDMGKITL